MKVALTSIGEKTTAICKDELEKMGFEVVMFDKVQPWVEKYKEFIEYAFKLKEPIFRIDADIIPNKNLIKDIKGNDNIYMIQFQTYDFYKNDICTASPILYFQEAIEIIHRNLDKLDPKRPEASASRLPELNPFYFVEKDYLTGMHGFFQDKKTIERAKYNKGERGQIKDYNFGLVDRLLKL